MGTRSLSLLNNDVYFHSGLDAQYGLQPTELVHLPGPTEIDVEFVISERSPYEERGFIEVGNDEALKLCKDLDDRKRKDTGKPLKGTHVFYHVTAAPQATTHQPFNVRSVQDPVNSAEVDGTVSADVNLQFHENNKEGWEFTTTAQASRNFILLDPNRYNPAFGSLSSQDKTRSERADQAQVQLQLAYAFNNIHALGLDFSFSVILLQTALAATLQYDPFMKKVGLTWGKSAAAGFGLDIEYPGLKGVKLTLQALGVGATAGGNRFFDFSAPTFDQSISAGIKFEFEGP